MEAVDLLTPEALSTLRRVPARLRDDAIGEALLAHAQGRDQAAAINAFRMREARHEAREVTFTDLGPHAHLAPPEDRTDRRAAEAALDSAATSSASGVRRADPPLKLSA